MIKKLIFGTTNEAKIKQIRGALSPMGIEVVGVADKSLLPEVDEDGKTPEENARKKAIAYAEALNSMVFSMDNALYLDGLPDDRQPATHVRRIGSRTDRPTDEEVLEYYSDLIHSLGGRVSGEWRFAVCIASPDGKFNETTLISPRTFTEMPSEKIISGYPLESLQIDESTGKYISEMNQEEQDVFWQRAIGEQLQKFVRGL